MTLLINNAEVAKVLTMETTMAALEEAYLALAAGEAVCRPRIDIRIPTRDPAKNYQWGTMEGGSTAGYFAIRMKSDVISETRYNGSTTQEKYCTRPGRYCGLILLTSIETGEPLAFINDGYLQHMRVGADGGIGVKYLAKATPRWSACSAPAAWRAPTCRRSRACAISKGCRCTVPRERTASNSAAKWRRPATSRSWSATSRRRSTKAPTSIAGVTDSAVPVLDGTQLMPGAHVINVGGGGRPDEETLRRVDIYPRCGDTPAPVGRPELAIDDEHLGFEARPDRAKFGDGRRNRRRHGNALPDRRVTLADLASGKAEGRTGPAQITDSERGNLQGRAVLRRCRQGLRGGQARRPGPRNPDRVVLARLKGLIKLLAPQTRPRPLLFFGRRADQLCVIIQPRSRRRILQRRPRRPLSRQFALVHPGGPHGRSDARRRHGERFLRLHRRRCRQHRDDRPLLCHAVAARQGEGHLAPIPLERGCAFIDRVQDPASVAFADSQPNDCLGRLVGKDADAPGRADDGADEAQVRLLRLRRPLR